MNIPILFNDNMHAENTSFSPSSSKPKLVVDDWQKHFKEKTQIVDFKPLQIKDFYEVHEVEHVNEIFNGKKPNGFGLIDSVFAKTFLYTSGSFYAACLKALETSIAVSPTSGFHHAEYDQAMGYCTFNGLVIAAHLLHKNSKAKKIGIIDLDMHYGNGTDDFIKIHDLKYIKHYTAGEIHDLGFYPYNSNETHKKTLVEEGKKFINSLPNVLKQFKDCDFIMYQAGADQHINDPYGGLIDYEQMYLRDKMVFEFCKSNSIPLAWNLAGGYQKEDNGGIEPVLQCHRNTMKACIETFIEL